MDIQLIKKTFKENFPYNDSFNVSYPSIKEKTPSSFHAPTLASQVQLRGQALNVAVNNANTVFDFFRVIIEEVATVYVLKQQQGAKKDDFEKHIKEGLKKCLGLGNEYFDVAIKGIIRRIDKLPDDFYKDKSHPLGDSLKAEIVNYFMQGKFDQDYLDTVFKNKIDAKADLNTTVFYICVKSSFKSGFGRKTPIMSVGLRYTLATGEGFSDDNVWQAFDTLAELCSKIDPHPNLAPVNNNA